MASTMTAAASSSPRTMALLIATVVLLASVEGFVSPSVVHRRPSVLHAAPKRLEENVEGVLYVNDKVRSLHDSRMWVLRLFS